MTNRAREVALLVVLLVECLEVVDIVLWKAARVEAKFILLQAAIPAPPDRGQASRLWAVVSRPLWPLAMLRRLANWLTKHNPAMAAARPGQSPCLEIDTRCKPKCPSSPGAEQSDSLLREKCVGSRRS